MRKIGSQSLSWDSSTWPRLPSGKGVRRADNRHTISLRWQQHVYEARSGSDQSRSLNRAIRQYGGSAFSLIECWECPDDELDEWEVLFIELFGTFGHSGYNLTLGGRGTRGTVCPNKNQSPEGWDLPNGVAYLTSKANEGFRVRYKGFDVQFTSLEKTMLEKYEGALSLIYEIDQGEFTPPEKKRPRAKQTRNLPKYVYRDDGKGCLLRSQAVGFPRKFFMSKRLSDEEKIALAQWST